MADRWDDLADPLMPAARSLATEHDACIEPAAPIPAWQDLDAASRWLQAARTACAEAPPEVGKAAEWLLDNDYQIHRAIRQIRQDLPKPFYARLPAVGCGGGPSFPRVFALAHGLLRVTRLQVSLAGAIRFVRGYQERQPLTIAELWAFPTMLRIACLEIVVVALTPMLRGVAPPFDASRWAAEPHGLDATGRVARGIANLGIVAGIPWHEFFDAVSLVEKALRQDPSGFYRRCDFETRDRCRRAIEELARYGKQTEPNVAATALRLALEAPADEAGRHVGHWLIGAGRPNLQSALGARFPPARRLEEAVLRHPGRFYAGALTLCASGAILLPVIYLLQTEAGIFGWIVGLVATFVPATILAVTTVHWAITRLLSPRILPKLTCDKGLPRDCATIIVMPVIVVHERQVAALAEQIETHWLANGDPMLRIALLADLPDASEAHRSEDDEILQALEVKVNSLNARHGRRKPGPFHLLVRPRLYNPAEGCWMAWERKRGKLEQFNRMLVEKDDSAFSLRVGHHQALEDIRFVVTVDADTMLPPGSVARLVGTLAHPLNQARFDEATGRIVSGYSIVQPRTEISPQSGKLTLFTRLFTGDTAIDIYSRAVSDVYQDLFGAGIFVGKGIYDLRAFHRSVDRRVPQNRILSHDLFEGAHGRVGLATDIVLYEGFPTTYLEYARRLHRWVRGDWQLLPWLARQVPAADGAQLESAFAGVDRWKILDNLRRSLVAPSILALILMGWFILPGDPWFWTLLAVFAPSGQLFADLVSGFARGRRRGAVRGLATSLADQFGRWLLAIIYLLHEALLSLHAIGVTLWRLAVSHRHLLEWTSTEQVAWTLSTKGTRRDIWRQMWAGPLLASIAGTLLAVLRPSALPVATPLLLLWVAVPEITLRIGRRSRIDVGPLEAEDVPFLRTLARRTWLYFETFAGPEDHWLPPDNYQAAPYEEIAHRTSPTNIGMLLLSTATAWDLGYIGRSELAARTDNVFDSLDRLKRYRGHFFNWYDTRSLKPLEPCYISAVDSGNLAVSLVAYAGALNDAAATPGLEPWRFTGLADVVAVLATTTGAMGLAALSAHCDSLRGRIERLALDPPGWLFGLGQICDEDLPELETLATEAAGTDAAEVHAVRELYTWLDRLRHQAATMLHDLGETNSIVDTLLRLERRARKFADAMDFRLLYDKERRLLFIGHNLSSGRTDTHHYDLLASEARLASLFAIAKGDLPTEHWFHLQRPVTRGDGGLSLISWNGSMFEYLMPRLWLSSGSEGLLGESERIAVRIQQRYGEMNGLPWGISESAFGERDSDHRYRYQAFGVPGLGLRRGLARDMVVAPYASALALAVAPVEAAANLRLLTRLGASELYGMIEALDFTPGRLTAGETFVPVKAWMAHHQGMILCAIGNTLAGEPIVRRFAQDPRVRLASLLLSERIPREIPSEIDRIEELERKPAAGAAARVPSAWAAEYSPAFPQVHLLGNGRLASWISEAGGGGLHWRGQALTRFVADATLDADGLWLYLVDQDSGAIWSAARQPAQAVPAYYRTTFHAHMVEFHRRDHDIESRLEIAVAAGDDLEVRRLNLANEVNRTRRLRITSCGEVVLAPALDHERHPAFSKLFVGSEFVPHLGGLLFTRRSRGPRETPPVLLHFVVGEDGPVATIRRESDRAAFVGRGGDLRGPAGARAPLCGGAGFSLDPVMALQLDVELKAFGRRTLCFVTVAGATAEAVIETAERYATLASLDWAIGDAATETGRVVERAGLDAERLASLSALASQLVYPHGPLRADATACRANRLGQSQLWGLALSGDLPILLLRSGGTSELLPLLIRAGQYWRRQGLQFDLVVLQTGGTAYVEPVRDEIADLLRDVGASETLGRRGGIHLLFADQIGSEQVRLIEAAAWVVLDDGKALEEQLDAAAALATPAELPRFAPSLPPNHDPPMPSQRPAHLVFDNGQGGFTPDGREYVILLGPDETTPAPWVNILANASFGTLVTERGGGFSWALNSGENRLTPWTNDPVTDRAVETLYLRDEETAAVWTVVPGSGGRQAACEIRHGAGYTIWRRRSHELEQEMLVFVPEDAPVKIIRLRLENLANRHRRLTSTYYVEWLLGALASVSRQHILCDWEAASHSLLAWSGWSADFAGRVAFLAASRPPHGFTTDRREFLGAEGDPARPAALTRWGLSGRIVAGPDPCAAYQVHHDLDSGENDEIVFVIGQCEDKTSAAATARHWIDTEVVDAGFESLKAGWAARLGAVVVRTPDPALDIMVNRWLLYQSLSSRFLARTGYYQSSGAFGFRDQLQDVLALLHAEPGLARAHILECAAHQFIQGDVLHWWHPPSGRGIRTRCSDDLVWLPFAAATYVRATGDLAILNEAVPFLEGAPLAPEEADRYARFDTAPGCRPLVDHMTRALEHALTQGAHGLPLMGSGDWNDGMDRVGDAGRGESVWLGWFLAETTELMADMERRLGRDTAAARWAGRAAELRARVDEAGWNDDRYRRAFDDEGHVLGTADARECSIDSISQSWAVLAGGPPERAKRALETAWRELVDPEAQLVRLLWPPFDKGPLDPGYIRAYPPGIRENGGQYAHAAAWLGLAYAEAGQGERAHDIFSMLSPVGRNPALYRVEPYVVAGDVAAAAPHRGRGGWTWYSGAAAWTWRLAVEGILGLDLQDGALRIAPSLPPGWQGYSAVLKRQGGSIKVDVQNPEGNGSGGVELSVDGKPWKGGNIPFPRDGSERRVVAILRNSA